MTNQTGTPDTAPVSEAGQLTIAHRLDAASLPGTFRKRAVVGTGETGLLVAGEQVKKTLGPGEHTLGRDDSLVRVHTRPFSLRLSFARLRSGDFETLDGIVQATVAVTDAALLYRTAVQGRDRLEASGLANIVSSALDDIVQAKTSDYEAEVLCHEAPVQERLAAELEPILRNGLAQRGLRLQSIDALVFRPSEEEDRLMAELQELRGQVETAEKQTWETMDRVAEHPLPAHRAGDPHQPVRHLSHAAVP